MRNDPNTQRDVAAKVAARDRALGRLRSARHTAAALTLAMVAGFAALASVATPFSSHRASAAATRTQQSSSSSDEASANGQTYGTSPDDGSWTDESGSTGSSGSTYSAPSASSQLPSVVSGGS